MVSAVGPDGMFPLPWIGEPLQQALRTQRGHALLIHGPQGIGQFELAFAMAQAWLCERRPQDKPCGQCASCKLVQAQSHPDLLVLVPEALREPLGLVGSQDISDDEGKASKTKLSQEVKVDAVRAAVTFSQSTSARGLGKVLLIHPAERMNAIAANTLLKTLEEPPGASRFLLSCGAADALLPTIRSRCQLLPLALPPKELVVPWLAGHKVAQPEVLLAGAGGQPLDALDWVSNGLDSVGWMRVPKQLAVGDAAALIGWPLPRLIDGMQKVCHDAMAIACGAVPRYFPAACMPVGASLAALTAWSGELRKAVGHAEHPWNQPVMVESLVLQAARALASGTSAKTQPLHSAR